jgi:hypothetical protein
MKTLFIIFTINFWIGTAFKVYFADEITIQHEFQYIHSNVPIFGALIPAPFLANEQEGLLSKIKNAAQKATFSDHLISLFGVGLAWKLAKWRKKVRKLSSAKAKEGETDTRGCMIVGCSLCLATVGFTYLLGLLIPSIGVSVVIGFVLAIILCYALFKDL